MTLQVVNTKKEKFNQIRTTKENLFADLKFQGWHVQDCKISELKEELVHTLYRSADGKNTSTR
jgi:hypothetical protein